MSTATEPIAHIGRKIVGIRNLRGMKQESLAAILGITQQAVSKVEASEEIDEERLEKVAEALNVSVEAIKNFKEDAAINIFGNTFSNTNNDQSKSSLVLNDHSVNPIEKIVELYERMLKLEQEKNQLLEALLKKNS